LDSSNRNLKVLDKPWLANRAVDSLEVLDLSRPIREAEVVSASKVSPVSAVPTTGKVAFSSFAPESTA
jgi:hypothetical protein